MILNKMDFSLIIRNKVVVFSKPIIMGILNATPDSFYDGGMFDSEKKKYCCMWKK